MKFLCDQCKAKYQIADEKVQGKTLRMKCRKCGHVIEIRATTPEAGGGITGETMQLNALSEEQANAAIAAARPSARPTAPTAPRPAAGAPVAPGKAAPRPGAPAAAPGKPAPRPSTAPRPAAAPGARPSMAPSREPPSALAHAFSKSVGTAKPEPPAAPTGHDPPAEEWYVAIDEVPVGPIRLTELRAKYAQGLVKDESLVWREGFEEWRPLRTLPELHELVKEEVSGAFNPPRGSLLPGAPRPNTAPRPAVNAPPRGTPSPSPALSAGPSRNNVIPFVQSRGGAAAARKIEDEPFDEEATQIAQSPFAQREPPKPAPKSSPPASSPPSSHPGARLVDDPFAAPSSGPVMSSSPPAAAATSSPLAPASQPPPAAPMFAPIASPPASTSTVEEPSRLTMLDRISVRARGVSKGTVALVAAACLLLGVVIAVVAVKPKVVEKVVEKEVQAPPSVVYVHVPGAAPSTAATAAPEAPSAAKVAVKGGTGAAATTAAPAASGTSKKLGSLDLGPEGPQVPGATQGGGGGGAPLDGKSVENVVASKKVGVRKVCYEPWSDKGAASVKITLKIAPSGSVSSADIASSSGEPAIAQCIQRMAKGWTFPASEAGGTFSIPFIFST